MPEWLILVLIGAAVIAAFVGFGAGRITTGPRMHNRSDRYDPVYLQQQEAQEAARHTDAP